MIHFTIITAVILSAFIEWRRIEAVKGRWLNVPKWVSWLFGAGLFAVVFWIFKPSEWYYIIPEMAFMRGLLYDPVLNKLRGLKWDYVSVKTNSWQDRIEAVVKAFVKRRFKIELTFLSERILYGLLALTFLLLYEWK